MDVAGLVTGSRTRVAPLDIEAQCLGQFSHLLDGHHLVDFIILVGDDVVLVFGPCAKVVVETGCRDIDLQLGVLLKGIAAQLCGLLCLYEN